MRCASPRMRPRDPNMAATLDTLQIVKRRRETGFDEPQAADFRDVATFPRRSPLSRFRLHPQAKPLDDAAVAEAPGEEFEQLVDRAAVVPEGNHETIGVEKG